MIQEISVDFGMVCLIALALFAARGVYAEDTDAPTASTIETYTNISAADARGVLDSGADVLFLDVREPGEIALNGAIPGSLNMPWNTSYLPAHHTELPAMPIIVYCASGGRSGTASQFLVDNGHTQISNMLGGYSAWKSLPTRTPLPASTDTPTVLPTSTPTPTMTPNADMNGDGVVDEKDVAIFLKSWHNKSQ